MTLTRQHFVLIANVLSDSLQHEHDEPSEDGAQAVEAVARRFANVLGETNDNFNRDRFLKACGVNA